MNPFAHRPFLTAEWRYLAMLNYEVDPAILEPLVPPGTQLDFHDDKTYVSVVGFLFCNTKVLGFPVPRHRSFEEVNLRFYLRRDVDGETRRGVAFVKEIVPRNAIAKIARWVYNENYVAMPMQHRLGGFGRIDGKHHVLYKWQLGSNWNSLQMRVSGQPTPLEPGSHQEFIAEHYFGYCRQRDGGVIEYRVEHPPWSVWQAEQVQLECSVEQLYGREFTDTVNGNPDSAFLAEGSPVAVYKPRRVTLYL